MILDKKAKPSITADPGKAREVCWRVPDPEVKT